MRYSSHARRQMAKRTITEGDVEAVLAAPTKELPADDGCVNVGATDRAENASA